ncbi:hypothetical protein ACLOJK_016669 [Asimina triloba]
MEREADLPQPKKHHHPIAATSDSLRHVQAAFKLQRSIGTVPSNVGRARRVLVPRKDSFKSSQQGSEKLPTAASERVDAAQVVIDQARGEDSFTAPPPNTETLTNITSAGDSKMIQFSSVSTAGAACREAFSQSKVAFEQTAADTGSKNLLLQATYLALTESQRGLNDQGVSFIASQNIKPQDYQHTQISDLSVQSSGRNCMLTKPNDLVHDQHFMGFLGKYANHTTTQSSVTGSSYVTATNIHSTGATTLNSTYNPHSHQDSWSLMGIRPSEDVSTNPEPIIQGGLTHALAPSQSTSMTLAKQTAMSTRVSSSAPVTSTGVQDCNLSKEQGLSIKRTDGLPEGCLDNLRKVRFDEKSTKQKMNVGEAGNIQPQAPTTKNLSSNVSLEPSQSSKSEKDICSKDPLAPRKKSYDPDMFPKVNGKRYQKLGKIGSGGSSEVHKVISSDCIIYALKSIKLKGRDYATAYGFCEEIEYLKKLKGKGNIIQLFDYEVTDKILLNEVMSGAMALKDGKINEDGYIHMVLEYGEIDLAHMLSQKWKEMDSFGWRIDENWLRFYWQQMLQAVNTIHEERIVHSDLKPANFLLVRGSLKLIDFGIAKAIMSDTTNIHRDTQVGTLNYMSPEAFLWNEEDPNGNTIKCGRPSDIWSLGCILYQMVYGRTPFAEYKTFWSKVKAITDKNHIIASDPVPNPWLLDLMKKCLAWDRDKRWRIPQLLQHPFLVPPIPPQVPSSREQHCKLLLQMIEAYEDIPEVSTLCYQLQKLQENLQSTGF